MAFVVLLLFAFFFREPPKQVATAS
jgi:hypothetical protein